jgi:hypothetical protein
LVQRQAERAEASELEKVPARALAAERFAIAEEAQHSALQFGVGLRPPLGNLDGSEPGWKPDPG